MPKINKQQESIIQNITTQNGEITIHLHLTISLEGNDIKIDVNSNKENKQTENTNQEFIPEENFTNLPLLDNFGN
jgi:hypothetical protein